MIENWINRPTNVVGPLGEALTFAMLPPNCPARWTVRRKAEVVAAVSGGLLSFDEACKRYSLSVEELTSWQRAVHRSGMPGLRVTKIAYYHDLYEPRGFDRAKVPDPSRLCRWQARPVRGSGRTTGTNDRGI